MCLFLSPVWQGKEKTAYPCSQHSTLFCLYRQSSVYIDRAFLLVQWMAVCTHWSTCAFTNISTSNVLMAQLSHTCKPIAWLPPNDISYTKGRGLPLWGVIRDFLSQMITVISNSFYLSWMVLNHDSLLTIVIRDWLQLTTWYRVLWLGQVLCDNCGAITESQF